ncbi:O-antigen ligase family protein [Neobacillus drentensis]|uniref:O-antigen ligase family protein n=1 Tax=Neobacillus drentensis TaxID=220684 RepID=UPI002FFF0494
MITLQSKMPQIVVGLLTSIILGWVSFTYTSSVSFPLLIVACLVLSSGFIVIVQYRQFFWKGLTLQHFLLSIMLAASFLGSAFLTVSAGPVVLFPYRVFLVLLTFVLLFKWLNKSLSFKGHFHIPYIYFFFFAWICYSLLALSWSVDFIPAIKEVITLVTGILVIFFLTILFKKEENYLEFFTIWIVMGLLLIGIGFINHFLQIHLPISRINFAYSYQKGIPTSVFVNENDFASFLAITSFFFLSLMKNGKRMIFQLIGLFGFLSAVFLILITESRANYIGIFLGCVFWFVFLLKRQEKVVLLGAGLMIAPMVIYTQYEKFKALWGLLYVQFESLLTAEEHHTSSVDIRENLLNNAKVFIENTSGLGVGPGNVEYYMKNYQHYETFHNYNVHNWWAEIFVQYGFLVFIGYIILFGFLFVALFRIWKKLTDLNHSLISEALLCGMIAFIPASISPNSFIALNYNWIFIAFVAAYVNFHYKELQPGGLSK